MLQARAFLSCVAATLCLCQTLPSSAATPTFALSVTASAGGKVTPGTTTARSGTTKTFAIEPRKGHHVAEVRVDGATVFEDRQEPSIPNNGSTAPPPSDPNLRRSRTSKVYKYTFRDIRDAHALEVLFEVDTFKLELIKSGTGSGVVTSSREGVSCGDTCLGVFPYNAVVTLSAAPDERSVFDRWIAKGAKAKGATLTLRITKAWTVTARFAKAYRLAVSVVGHGVVARSPKGMSCVDACEFMVREGTTVKLSAKPARDSIFLGWTGPTKSAGGSCAVAMKEDQFVLATFAPKSVPPYDLNVDDLPESVILEPPAVIPEAKGAYAHCYIESLTAQMAYVDPTVTMDEVFTFSGLGAGLSYSRYGRSFLGSPPSDWTWTLQRRAIFSYGAHFILGHSRGVSKEYLKGADGQLVHATAEEALVHLKAVLRTGRPVQVHIDLAYLLPDSGIEPGASHFIAITGYDAEAVYWTGAEPGYIDFPLDPSEYVNVRVDLADFLLAWEAAGWINKGSFTYCAPYWMLFLEETQAAELERITVGDVLSLHASLSQNNAAVIDRYLGSDFSRTPWWKIAMEKRLFAEYLRRNGFLEAADRYELLSEEYARCGALPTEEQRQRLDGPIRSLEVEGRELY